MLQASDESPSTLIRSLNRVGIAATLMIAGGIAIVLMLMPLVGYNSLAQSLPKAILDGVVLMLLMGQRTAWRYLALLGVAVGLFLGFVMPAYPHLLVLMSVASGCAMAAGWTVERMRLGRFAAVVTAGIAWVLLTSTGKPLQIWLGTADGNEPLLWSLYFAEWPLRIIGVTLGISLIQRGWLSEDASVREPLISAAATAPGSSRTRKLRGVWSRQEETRRAAFAAVLALAACSLPMIAQQWWQLSVIMLAFVVMTVLLGLRQAGFHAAIAVTWGWLIFALASLLWHGEVWRAMDLGRTFWLRFMPMTLCAMLIITTIRPVAMFRLFRQVRLPAVVLLPVATVLRLLPAVGRDLRHEVAMLKSSGVWTSRWSVLRQPVRIGSALLERSLGRLARDLRES